jgi:hypothetical protein
MRPGWKKAAKCAEKAAYEVEEIADSIVAASCGDWRTDVSDQLVGAVSDVLTGDLFSARDEKVTQLEAMRTIAGYGLGQILIDCAIQQSTDGASSRAVLEAAVGTALATWWARHGRQIEEHYCRESSARRTRDVRTRMEAAIRGISTDAVIRQILGPSQSQHSHKKIGLDDGVRL